MSFKKKPHTGELMNTNAAKGVCADIKRLRGKYTSDFPVKRGMFFGRPKRKEP